MLTFSIGGIHGCYDKLVGLLRRCRDYAQASPYRLIFLGDYIDRGDDSRAVVDLIVRIQAHAKENSVICLLGNHEQMLLKSFSDPVAKAQWLLNGGAETLESYS